MDYYGASSDGEWSSLGDMYTAEEVDFMARLLGGSCSLPPSHQPDRPRVQSALEHRFSFDSNELLHEFDHNTESCFFERNNSMEVCVGDYMNKTTTTTITDDECYIVPQNPKKRTNDPSNHHVETKKRNVKAAKKSPKAMTSANNDEEGNVVSCSYSNDNINVELSSSLSLTSKGKVRASRGSASDPQSLYARKRREKINERLKILQNLVPNGTKVDISTMLEEAVEYVKFLQLQIKLLSSDDMWMYSPIAYNGMDLGLNITIPTSRA